MCRASISQGNSLSPARNSVLAMACAWNCRSASVRISHLTILLQHLETNGLTCIIIKNSCTKMGSPWAVHLAAIFPCNDEEIQIDHKCHGIQERRMKGQDQKQCMFGSSLRSVHKSCPCKSLAVLDGNADNVSMPIKWMGQLMAAQAVDARSIPAHADATLL